MRLATLPGWHLLLVSLFLLAVIACANPGKRNLTTTPGASGTEPSPTVSAETGAGHYYPLSETGSGLSVNSSRVSTSGIEPLRLTSLAVSSSRLVLQPGRAARLTVTPLDQFGVPIAEALVTWHAQPDAGTIDGDGEFVSAARAGSYPDGVTATVSFGGVTETASVPVEITPGPVAAVHILPERQTLFTGDEILISVTASDASGNPVELADVAWGAPDAETAQSENLLAYRASRAEGQKSVTATVTDGSGNVATGKVDLSVQQGRCGTTVERARWHVEWHALDPGSGEQAGLLSAETADSAPSADWGDAPVAAGHADYVSMAATTQIVVRRHGPVSFTIGGDDGYRVKLDGEDVPGLRNWTMHGYEERTVKVVLEPGVYDLELDYYEWTGGARLRFDMDEDVLQWDQIAGCTGTYSYVPDNAIWVSVSPLDVLARRFGVPDAQLVPDVLDGQNVTLVHGNDPPRKVIVLQGLNTNATCRVNYPAVFATDASLGSSDTVAKTAGGWQKLRGFAQRTSNVLYAIQADHWAAYGSPGPVDISDIVHFSYAGNYQDCAHGGQVTHVSYTASGSNAVYDDVDTCLGVVPATRHLKSLIQRLIEVEPGVQIDIVGHSMGGMVAAYFMSQEPETARQHIRSVVTLDSPLQGFGFAPFCGGDAPAILDILGETPVVPAILSLAGTDLASRITSLAATDIGSAIPGNILFKADCDPGASEKLGEFGESLFGTVGGIIGRGFGSASDIWKGHNCVWDDEGTLKLVARVVNG